MFLHVPPEFSKFLPGPELAALITVAYSVIIPSLTKVLRSSQMDLSQNRLPTKFDDHLMVI